MTQEQEDVKNLRSAGFIAIAKQYREMASALKVIHTWASCDANLCRKTNIITLDADDTIALCDKTLRRFYD